MQEKSFYFLVEISLICENVMSVMSEGLTSAASESTMRLISGSVNATRELSAIKGCDLSTRATYLRVYTVFKKKIKHTQKKPYKIKTQSLHPITCSWKWLYGNLLC